MHLHKIQLAEWAQTKFISVGWRNKKESDYTDAFHIYIIKVKKKVETLTPCWNQI